MIIDKLSNISRYHPHFKSISEYINQNDLNSMKLGKHTISENLFVIIMEYETNSKDKHILENHKQYIDFQLILIGKETVAVSHSFSSIQTEYIEKDDYELFVTSPDFITFSEGQFAVFFPGDYHRPGIICNKSQTIKKAVFKIKI